ncbi:unnamed protein product [Heterobilharzia americana]|nr:unnamed protein product [Heterobilharzia americana]CAH8668947.1 unnamed protein product [Heterobilharzia americana]
MSVIFTVGKKATEIISSTSSPLPKVRRANGRIAKTSTSNYQPSENVIVWNLNLDGNQVSLAYCTDTQILWCNDQQIQIQVKGDRNSQESHFSLMNHQGLLSILHDMATNVATYKLYIDGNEIKRS